MATTQPEAEAAIRAVLERRDRGKTICPSEAARALAGEDGFRALMPLVRSAARTMVDRGELEVTQRGEVVDPDSARGAIRLRLPSTAEFRYLFWPVVLAY